MSGITFDGWKTQLYEDYLAHGQGGLIVGTDCLAIGQDSLMHFRTKGSKNGVRRYQMPDGTWTPLGLRERRVREGFGERREARREARAQRRSERKAAKAAERSARAERMAKFKAERAEAKRKRNVKNLTDKELEKGINRLKMEQEYRELSKSPLLKAGEALVSKYMDYRTSKLQAEAEREKRKLEYTRLRTEAENTRVKASADKATAKANLERAKADALEVRKGDKAAANKAKLVGAKVKYRETTIRGAIGRFFNKNADAAGKYKAVMAEKQAEIDAGRAKVLADIDNDRTQNRYNQWKAMQANKQQQKAANAQQRAAQKAANAQKRAAAAQARAQERERKRRQRLYGYSGTYGAGSSLN